ncbi:MAG: B12-binding domain-containing radical SAM protein [Candidatus Scalinduaceae bacterium]
MKNRILLINSWIHDFTAFNLWAKPLGLLYVASTLHRFGYNVNMIDCLHNYGRPLKQQPYGTGFFHSQEIEKPSIFKDIPRRYKRYGMSPEEFQNRLKKIPKPLLVCVTSHMTYWYPGVFEVIRMVKTVFPSVPIALGGIYATLCYKHAADNSGADYVIQGAGELEVLKLADNLSGKRRNYSQLRKWLEDEMSPAYELYPKLNAISILTSRGCPFRCTYCASFRFESSFILRNSEKVVSEIERYVATMGVKDIAFYDDALLVNSERHIMPILESLIEKGLPAQYHTPNGLHPRYIDLPLARLLWKVGFKTIRMGFEGTSRIIQQASRYKVNGQELENALYCLREVEDVQNSFARDRYSTWDIGVYILAGLPEQTVDEVVEAMEYVNKLGARIKLAEYSPVPGTEEFKRASKLCPQIENEPLCHNKSTFAIHGMGIDYDTFDEMKSLVKQLNSKLDGSGIKHWSS